MYSTTFNRYGSWLPLLTHSDIGFDPCKLKKAASEKRLPTGFFFNYPPCAWEQSSTRNRLLLSLICLISLEYELIPSMLENNEEINVIKINKPKFIDIGTEGSIIESKKKAQKILFND